MVYVYQNCMYHQAVVTLPPSRLFGYLFFLLYPFLVLITYQKSSNELYLYLHCATYVFRMHAITILNDNHSLKLGSRVLSEGIPDGKRRCLLAPNKGYQTHSKIMDPNQLSRQHRARPPGHHQDWPLSLFQTSISFLIVQELRQTIQDLERSATCSLFSAV